MKDLAKRKVTVRVKRSIVAGSQLICTADNSKILSRLRGAKAKRRRVLKLSC